MILYSTKILFLLRSVFGYAEIFGDTVYKRHAVFPLFDRLAKLGATRAQA